MQSDNFAPLNNLADNQGLELDEEPSGGDRLFDYGDSGDENDYAEKELNIMNCF